MTDQQLTDENKAIVRSFYEGGTDSNGKEYTFPGAVKAI
jgi:hypothetical protein